MKTSAQQQMTDLKRCDIYIHKETLLSIKKNEILPFAAAWMDLENTILSEASQAEKGKIM